MKPQPKLRSLSHLLRSAVLGVICLVGTAHAESMTEFGGSGTITLTSVKRADGGTITIKGKISNSGQKQLDLYSAGMVDGSWRMRVKLQDLAGKKEFHQVTAGDYTVGSVHDKEARTVDPGGSVNFWTRVTAPPPEVKKVSVIFGGDAAPMDDVTIEE